MLLFARLDSYFYFVFRKAVKATVILFPLLGITYVLFIVPPSDQPQVHIVFNYINAILQSLQVRMETINNHSQVYIISSYKTCSITGK